jgi:hypothetical protein
MTDSDIDKVERSYIPLATEIDGSVIIGDLIFDAKVVGVEINGEDIGLGGDKMVVLVEDDGSTCVQRVSVVFRNEHYADIELKRRLALHAT